MPDWAILALIVAAVVGLAAAADVFWRQAFRQRRRLQGSGFWRALWPNFAGVTLRNGRIDIDRGTNRTLHLLIAAMLAFMIALAGWAVAAGVLRAAWIYSCSPDGFAPASAGPCRTSLGLADWSRWLTFAAVLLAEILRAVGGVLAIAIGAGLAGAGLGFLFGIPRYEPRETTPGGGEPPAGAQRAGAQQAGAQQQAGRQQQAPTAPRQAAARLQLNTNLIKISDWLTNGIVVLSLVEAKTFGSGFLSITQWAANWLFDGRHGSPVLLGTAILGSAVFGLLYGTVYTQLIITRLLAAVDDTLRLPSGRPPIPTRRLLQAEALAPQISRFSHPEMPPPG
jgi:hypothetical protein